MRRRLVYVTTFLISVLAVLMLNGCSSSTLTPEDCALGAWYAVGRVDGIEGKSDSLLGRHQKACSKYDINIDVGEYHAGYREGNKTYCENYNHYGAGVSGEPPATVCSGEPYQSQYAEGIQIYCRNFDHFAEGEAGRGFNQRCPTDPYYAQYENGLVLYCANTNPYELGRSGGRENRVCGQNFTSAYTLGRDAARMEEQIQNTETQLAKEIRQLIDTKDPDETIALKDKVRNTEENLQQQRRALLEIKLDVRELGYMNSDELLDDLIIYGI